MHKCKGMQDKMVAQRQEQIERIQKQPSRGDLSKRCSKNRSKFIRKLPCRTAISIKLLVNLLKSHFGMGVLPQICCMFSNHLFLRTRLEAVFEGMQLMRYSFEENLFLAAHTSATFLFRTFLSSSRFWGSLSVCYNLHISVVVAFEKTCI